MKELKKKYIEPTFDITLFKNESVLTVSFDEDKDVTVDDFENWFD
jgi:hypothetical protein